jgi:hypothetical protein
MKNRTNQFLTPLVALNFFKSAACWLYNTKFTLIVFVYAFVLWLSKGQIIFRAFAFTLGWLLKIFTIFGFRVIVSLRVI